MAYQNFFATKLLTDIDAVQTTITLETPPTATSGRLVLEARNVSQREIISYSGVSGNSITGCVRGLTPTIARTHSRNALVEMNAVAQDLQDLYDAFNSFSATNGSGWLTAVTMPSAVVYNGQHSYTITYPSSVASIKSKGIRSRFTRTVAAPTQCTSLNGSSQYYSKTTPSGMTFTDDFCAGAFIKLTSYPAVVGEVLSRFDGTSGWVLRMNSFGQMQLVGYNAGSGNVSFVQSAQSVPLNKWIHIGAQLDMSAFTATTTTSYIMFDGVDVPATVTRTGTNPTALVQAGTLQVGASNSTFFFPGKIAQAFVTSAKVTQANMRTIQSQGIASADVTALSMVSAYSFSNSINDLNTSNANNLTANGGALATNADSPFGNSGVSSNFEYAVTTDISADGLTETVQVPEGGAIPTSGGINAVSYSTSKSPYLFPLSKDKWRLQSLHRTSTFTTANVGTYGSYMAGAFALTVPICGWAVGWQVGRIVSGTVSVGLALSDQNLVGVAEAAPGMDTSLTTWVLGSASASTSSAYAKKDVNHSAQTTYKMYTVGNTTASELDGTRGIKEIFAENTYI